MQCLSSLTFFCNCLTLGISGLYAYTLPVHGLMRIKPSALKCHQRLSVTVLVANINCELVCRHSNSNAPLQSSTVHACS